ncbi:Sec-independent protein translocase protein TatB [Sphingomonas faeni]|uniref:Sec-independent protein translocase protein TatB n=1 Tax=Sphingomonas faeni TaxID=185950 RepID=UPI003D7FD8B5
MFDIAPSEFLLVAFVALVVIGPKDLPKAMRVVGYWVGKARGVARQFRSGFDSMVREAELEEMEKRWASENERIMREHPQTGSDGATDTAQVVHSPETDEYRRDYRSADHADGNDAGGNDAGGDHAAGDHTDEPVMVEKPVVAAAPPTVSSTPAPADPEQPPIGHSGSDLSHTPPDTPASTAPAREDKTGKSDVAPS